MYRLALLLLSVLSHVDAVLRLSSAKRTISLRCITFANRIAAYPLLHNTKRL